MSGFDSAFHEQPVNMIGMGIGPVSLPGMNIPHGYIGPDARPCGGIGGYDAAANEGVRLREAAWNSVPTHNIHEPYRGLNTSASMPDLPRNIYNIPKPYKLPAISASMPDLPRNIYNIPNISEPYKLPDTLANSSDMVSRIAEENLEHARIQRQRGPLTVFEQTGDSHISHVAGKGFHVTTQVPGIGRDEGLDEVLAFHTYVKPDRNGRLGFDSDY